MPLTDFVRTLNHSQAVFPAHYARTGLDQPFVAADGRVFLHYANIRLESQFLPIVETASGKLHGHAASLQAFGLSNRIPLLPESVFVLPTDNEEFVYLDRLVRTLHALNYLTQPERGNLLLKVHARHLLSVSSRHGLAFEEILKPCGLLPAQITLEMDINGIDDAEHLIRAVDSYRSRGYGIAIGRFGRNKLDFGLLRELQPDIVKLDPSLLSSHRPIAQIIESIQQMPARVMVDNIELAALRKPILASGIDLLGVSSNSKIRLDLESTQTALCWANNRSAA